VRRDNIRLGNVGSQLPGGQRGEVGLDEVDICDSRFSGERSGGGNVGRAKVDAGHSPMRVCGGERDSREPIAATELQIREWEGWA
jgi:hypothetical protein